MFCTSCGTRLAQAETAPRSRELVRWLFVVGYAMLIVGTLSLMVSPDGAYAWSDFSLVASAGAYLLAAVALFTFVTHLESLNQGVRRALFGLALSVAALALGHTFSFIYVSDFHAAGRFKFETVLALAGSILIAAAYWLWSRGAAPRPLISALMPLFCLIRGSGSAGEAGWVGAEGEHRERDEWCVSVEPERDAREEPDLGVG